MTDVRLVKDCGLYSSYKKIIDFTGTKSQIITKQLSWIDTFNPMFITDANYNKFQNRLVLEMDYEEALTYTYAVMTDITGSGNKPMFFFVDEVENLTNGIEDENPNVAFTFTLDPVMTYMGEFSFAECMVDREHVDRWTLGSSLPKRITPNIEGASGFVEYLDDFGLSEEHNGIRIMLGVICVVQPSGKLKYYLFPYSPDSNLAYKSNAGPDAETYPVIYGNWPTLQQIRTGSILDYFSIQPDSVAGIFLYPIFSVSITYSNELYFGTTPIVAINGDSDGTYPWNVRLGGLIYYTNVSALYDASDDVDDINIKYKGEMENE